MGTKSFKKSKRRHQPNRTPTEQELFGKSRRYRYIGDSGPSISGCTLVGIYRNRVPGYITPLMERIGNIEYGWHGTSADDLKSIARDGLLRPVSIRRRGLKAKRVLGSMFGPGIYVSPSIAKASTHAVSSGFKFLLRCLVSLGTPLYPTSTGNKRQFCGEGLPYDSVVANAGAQLVGSWVSNLRHAEWVVYDNQQLTVDEIYVYTRVPQSAARRPIYWGRSGKRAVYVLHHPCKREGKTCVYAYHYSGCIKHNKKAGCSVNGMQFCRDFRLSRT